MKSYCHVSFMSFKVYVRFSMYTLHGEIYSGSNLKKVKIIIQYFNVMLLWFLSITFVKLLFEDIITLIHKINSYIKTKISIKPLFFIFYYFKTNSGIFSYLHFLVSLKVAHRKLEMTTRAGDPVTNISLTQP